jgi:hypothetical protein
MKTDRERKRARASENPREKERENKEKERENLIERVQETGKFKVIEVWTDRERQRGRDR